MKIYNVYYVEDVKDVEDDRWHHNLKKVFLYGSYTCLGTLLSDLINDIEFEYDPSIEDKFCYFFTENDIGTIQKTQLVDIVDNCGHEFTDFLDHCLDPEFKTFKDFFKDIQEKFFKDQNQNQNQNQKKNFETIFNLYCLYCFNITGVTCKYGYKKMIYCGSYLSVRDFMSFKETKELENKKLVEKCHENTARKKFYSEEKYIITEFIVNKPIKKLLCSSVDDSYYDQEYMSILTNESKNIELKNKMLTLVSRENVKGNVKVSTDIYKEIKKCLY